MSQERKCHFCSNSMKVTVKGDADAFECVCDVCGKSIQSTEFVSGRPRVSTEAGWLISAWIRNENKNGNIPKVDINFGEEILEKLPRKSIEEKLKFALLRIAEDSKHGGFAPRYARDTDYPLFWAENRLEMIWIFNQLEQLGYYTKTSAENVYNEGFLTAEGWEKVEWLKNNPIETKQVFVAMWFHKGLDPIYENAIKAAIEHPDVGYVSLRIDWKPHNNRIDEEIIMEMRRSRFLVADLTGNRGGVYFEAGFAKGLGREVIWTCRKGRLNRVHFDTRQYNFIEWENEEDLRKNLIWRIKANNL